MVKWTVGETNFCKPLFSTHSLQQGTNFALFLPFTDSTFRRKQAEKLARQQLGLD